MGSSSVLVIGDDWREKLDRYQSMEYARPLSPHIVHINRLDDARMRYPNATTALFRLPDGREVENFEDELKQGGGVRMSIVHKPLKGAVPFAEWAGREYGVSKLASGVNPDLNGAHRWGWIRTNDMGEVTELVERTIPGGFYFYFSSTCKEFLLKPGAIGWDTNGHDETTEVGEGYAGTARLSDIDFAAMRQKKSTMSKLVGIKYITLLVATYGLRLPRFAKNIHHKLENIMRKSSSLLVASGSINPHCSG
jgi:hypothetical protein